MNRALSSHRRVVITGMGLISPLGNSLPDFWDALSEGRSGVRELRSLPPAALPCPFAAEAIEFTGAIDDYGPLDPAKKKAIRKSIKMMSRESQMGVAAAQRALADSGLSPEIVDPDRTGVLFGSDLMLTRPEDFTAGVAKCGRIQDRFHFARWGTDGLGEMSPLWLLKYLPNMPACHFAIFNDFRGPNNSVTQREAAGLLAIGEAFHTIRRGHADRIVSGATGTRVHPMKTIHAVGQAEIARGDSRPAEASRPFDRHRSGMVLGEGAAAVVLEELGAAEARKATIYAEVRGIGSAFAADHACRGKWQQALTQAMKNALDDAHAAPADVGHVNAHGLSDIALDAEEARAISSMFDSDTKRIPVVAAKSFFGNLGAGSGVVELIASLLALRKRRLFRTLNYETPDPECPVFVVTDPEMDPGESVLALNVTPQGQAAALFVADWR
ncbi:MAG: beta-ketoacyl-[acyl-carrier-protein] synthase family protein [Pirellulales bacterium]|nr:beta-ketoacyl-[acyl-carrier-protein] synthase family protein [Pirellulales bacterium]